MSRAIDPASPPQTPMTASPVSNRKPIVEPLGHHNHIRRPLSSSQNLADSSGQQPHLRQPPGKTRSNGIPFRPNNLRPDELSPCSSDSSAVMNDGGNAEEKGSEYNDDDDNDDIDEDSTNVDDDGKSESESDVSESDSQLQSSDSEEQSTPSATSRQPPAQRHVGNAKSSPVPSSFPVADGKADAAQPKAGGASATEAGGPPSATGFLYVEATLIIEEISDYDSDDSRIQILRPDAIEEALSERSRSQSPSKTQGADKTRQPNHHHLNRRRRSSVLQQPAIPEMDRSVMSGLRGFSLRADSDGDSDEEALLDDDDYDDDDDNDENGDIDEAAYNQFRLRQREERRHRRMTSGSIGKRTISESIGSDSDNEDLRTLLLDASEAGSSARRLRRRIGDRHSLQFADPPPPRIDELDEPDTTDNDDDIRELTRDGETLARELPYYTLEYISMEVDSP
ncbi:hypothetical protein SPI_03316 [Niveomyces insectorum RCEF 264]|uniref:Uncharacterized protein n=1 Tax=Niveomyces insectorum RCEF 264 TaxID=1081102 RepID=A0A167X8W2_9HYPO|nr:hypothetical protein SPI_03316 [Niveomyces insectorum RCEF 264]